MLRSDSNLLSLTHWRRGEEGRGVEGRGGKGRGGEGRGGERIGLTIP